MARVLVIDDEDFIRDLLRTMLEIDGHQVIEAPNGKIGAKLFRENPTDLVVTDILMPEGDGALTIRQLKRDYPDIKIIAISGGGSIADPDTCLNVASRYGALRVFAKPFSKRELLAAVRELVG